MPGEKKICCHFIKHKSASEEQSNCICTTKTLQDAMDFFPFFCYLYLAYINNDMLTLTSSVS